MQDELKPVAWIYAPTGTLSPGHDPYFVQVNRANMDPRYWTETPLYAHPPTTNPVAVSETPVGDHQMVTQADMDASAKVSGFESWEDAVYWSNLAKQHAVQNLAQAFARHRQSALTAARAQVDKFRHVKRGTIYEVIGTAELQIANTRYTPGEGDLLVVYRGEDGKIWCREEGEFHDGRFAALAAGEHRKDG